MGFVSVMDWNLKTAPEWEWENIAAFSAKTNMTKRIKPTKNELEVDGGIDNASISSPGGGRFSGSESGHISSSKSSISGSGDSSLKKGMKTYETGDGFPEDSIRKRKLGHVDSVRNFQSSDASAVSGESMIGLKLGKRTYFEDVCVANATKSSSFPMISAPSVATTKRSRASYQSTQAPQCQVEGCNLDLKSAKDYHRRHRICESHSKSPKVIVAGMERRFCQQCSRFHELSEFDDKKRSCRRRLSDHNARRRRPQPEAIQFNSGRLSSPFYGGRRQLNVAFDRVPFHAANPMLQNASGFKVTQARDSLIGPFKAGDTHKQYNFPFSEMPDVTSMLEVDSEKVLSFGCSTPQVFSQGFEVSASSSNLDVAPDLRRALSLLSIPWGLNEPEPTSTDPLVHFNQTSMAQPVMHADMPNWGLAPPQPERVEQPALEARLHSLNYPTSSTNNFQEFQLLKAPYESGCFSYSNQIN